MGSRLKVLSTLIGGVLFLAALVVLHQVLREHSYHEISGYVRAVPPLLITAAALLTILNYAVLTGYDLLALRYVDHPLPLRRIAWTSFSAYAFSQSLGLTLVTGPSVRFRMYSRWGLPPDRIARIIAFTSITFWLGLGAVGGLTFLSGGFAPPEALSIPPAILKVIGLILLLPVVVYLVATARLRRPIRIHRWEVRLPGPGLALAQVLLSSADWLLAAAVFHILLPPGSGTGYLQVLGIFLFAQLAGIISNIPAGLGVFETVVLLTLAPTVGTPRLVGVLVVYRLIYYLLPLLIAEGGLALQTLTRHRVRIAGTARSIGRTLSPILPDLFALTTFLGGLVLLLSGATPPVHSRFAWLREVLPLPVVEVSHFLGSVAGAGLLLLSAGIRRRLDAALHGTLLLLGAGIFFSLLKGLDWEEAGLLALMLLLLVGSRREFHRRASLTAQALTPAWTVAVVLALAASVWLGLFAYRNVGYDHELWWQFTFSGDAPRFLRASVGAAMVVAAFALTRLLRTARFHPPAPGTVEMADVRSILAGAPEASACLALLGDKHFLFDMTGSAFVMYGIAGRSWVAMGDPVGPPAAAEEAAWLFRERSVHHGARTVFYEVGTAHLDLYLEMGLDLTRLGEEARVSLEDFNLEGHNRKGLRHTLRQVEGQGVTFRIIPPDEVAGRMEELRRISEDWMAEKNAREKHFSLGWFQPAYLMEFPMGVAEQEGRILAFTNIWSSGGKEELSIDLMRHSSAAPAGTMEYLFTRLMLWGSGEGYHWFNLGMVPFSGMSSRRMAPVFHRLSGYLFRHGEQIYHFQGLRSFKDKFDPVWRPRYLASHGLFGLARSLTDAATLISGDLSGVVGK